MAAWPHICQSRRLNLQLRPVLCSLPMHIRRDKSRLVSLSALQVRMRHRSVAVGCTNEPYCTVRPCLLDCGVSTSMYSLLIFSLNVGLYHYWPIASQSNSQSCSVTSVPKHCQDSLRLLLPSANLHGVTSPSRCPPSLLTLPVASAAVVSASGTDSKDIACTNLK